MKKNKSDQCLCTEFARVHIQNLLQKHYRLTLNFHGFRTDFYLLTRSKAPFEIDFLNEPERIASATAQVFRPHRYHQYTANGLLPETQRNARCSRVHRHRSETRVSFCKMSAPLCEQRNEKCG
jgi:hypothetical protein